MPTVENQVSILIILLIQFLIFSLIGDLDKTLDTSIGGINPGGLSITEIINFDRGGVWAEKAYEAPKEPHWHHLAGSN